MKVPYVNLKEQHAPLKKKIISSISKILDRSDFILGEDVKKCEDQFARYVGSKHAIGVNSGTDALFLALAALGIGKGHEVITAPNSFLASASAIVETGATPVFADVGEDMNLDPQKVADKITDRTRAILAVHLTGKPAKMAELSEIARQRGIAIIEDAAQAIGTEYRGKKAGNLSTVGCFSLHPLKTLNACGDGGMITLNDELLFQKISQLRNIGLKNRIESDFWGFNSRLDSLQAAIVNVKLKFVESWVKQRRKNADYYRKHLSDVVLCPKEDSNERHAYHLFVIRTDRRDELQQYLLKSGIETKIHYPIPIHLQKCSESLGYKLGDFPVTEKQSKQILSLPIYQTLSTQQLDFVISKIKKFFGQN